MCQLDGTTLYMNWVTSLCAPCNEQGIVGMCQSEMAQTWTLENEKFNIVVVQSAAPCNEQGV